MSGFSTSELRRFEWAGGALALAGIAVLALAKIEYDPMWFWADYVFALYGWGWVALGLGVALAGLAALRGRTRFLDVDEAIAPDVMTLAVVAIAIATAIACYAAVSKLPRTPSGKLPQDPAKREMLLKVERNTRILLGLFVVAAGAGFAVFPVIRHIRNAGTPKKKGRAR